MLARSSPNYRQCYRDSLSDGESAVTIGRSDSRRIPLVSACVATRNNAEPALLHRAATTFFHRRNQALEAGAHRIKSAGEWPRHTVIASTEQRSRAAPHRCPNCDVERRTADT